ncbi:SDR family NAD(P)-dependent oxidoreductase [Aspergillus saccharolyticus JOP 1030-1]|uniref:NAD(P)-binding protein n=1 Tax=Aspergillus saccharolyticus JOP 1030-1 TaxID=1450539 RepID=A0A318ZQE0_9EURO|nr:NAD(P)-binding protein [Aspergillus saccharolyticus JOP 1030-1]PYH42328.1 NAD(P)-binding protein [Aspergillus saccharolyticus JOP 1030-1]
MRPNYSVRMCAAPRRSTPSSTLLSSLTHAPRAYSTSTSSTETPQFTPSNRLKGRSCIITGASSGIGYAIADRFLQEGVSQLILVGRSHSRLIDAASRLEGASSSSSSSTYKATDADPSPPHHELLPYSPTISLLIGDIASAGTWTRELEKVMQTTNPTILINAAGLSISSLLAKSSPSTIAQILDTNLQGAILTTRAFLRAAMRNRVRVRRGSTDTPTQSEADAAADAGAGGSGVSGGSAASAAGNNAPQPSKCIINIASLLAHKGGTGAVTYAASKAGILGLTRSVAVEAAGTVASMPGAVPVRANVIVPGYVETPMISDFTEGETTRLKQSIPLGRFGLPQEVADAAVFLAENEYANNCVLNLDGGLSAV